MVGGALGSLLGAGGVVVVGSVDGVVGVDGAVVGSFRIVGSGDGDVDVWLAGGAVTDVSGRIVATGGGTAAAPVSGGMFGNTGTGGIGTSLFSSSANRCSQSPSWSRWPASATPLDRTCADSSNS